MVSFTHEQNVIGSQTLSQTKLNDTAHEQTIICKQLFAGQVEKQLQRMIINILIYV